MVSQLAVGCKGAYNDYSIKVNHCNALRLAQSRAGPRGGGRSSSEAGKGTQGVIDIVAGIARA